MHIAFLNIQGNFDPQDRYWTAHPDFGGQLVYVKEVALALGGLGHHVDILTRQIKDPEWQGFESRFDEYPGHPNVRIIRLPCGADEFLRKEDLWPVIGTEWVPNIIEFYANEGRIPDTATAHYADAGLAAAIWQSRGGPQFTFTGHSLGAQKLERLLIHNHTDLTALDSEYHFVQRIVAERVAMSHSARIITSTLQERQSQYSHALYEGAVDVDNDSKFAIIPPGVNLHIFDSDTRGLADERVKSHIQQVLLRDIPEERHHLPIVICSSRLDPKKNHIGLVLAFAHNTELQSAANLMLVVHGSEDIHKGMHLKHEEKVVMDEIVAACEAHGLWGKVCTCALDGQDEIAGAYRYLAQRRSIFSLTALYEPFGLAPLEAMAAGLPAVVTRCGGPSESLYNETTNTEYGVLVDPANPSDIAQGLLRLLNNPDEWKRFRDAGRKRVLERYTWERTAEAYLKNLQSMLEGKAAKRGHSKMPIPRYFTEPLPEYGLKLDLLKSALV